MKGIICYSDAAFFFVNLWHSWLSLIEAVPEVYVLEINRIHLSLPLSDTQAVLAGLQILRSGPHIVVFVCLISVVIVERHEVPLSV